MDITYPDIKVDLTGTDRNAFGLLAGRVSRAIRDEVGDAEANAFFAQATACTWRGELEDLVAHTVTVSRKAAR